MNARIKERIEQINSGIVPDGYQKSAFGIFPCDWEEVELATIAEFCGGGTPSSKVSRYWQGNIPWISSADISEGEIFGVEVSRYITKEAVDNSSTKICPKGSIAVVTRVGVGKLAYMNKDYCTSQDFTNIIKSSVNKYMLAYAVQNAIQKHKERAQGTSIKGITAKEFGAIKISPPKSTQEQARIAEILMQWDKAIELQGKLVEAYQKLKKYCLNKMFPKKGSNVPEIRFPGFTAPWEQRKINTICEKTYGGGTPSTSDYEFWTGEIPWIQSSDIVEHNVLDVIVRKRISMKAIRSSATQQIPANSIAIITRVGVGKLAFMPFLYATSQDFLSLSGLRVNALFATYALYIKLQNDMNIVQGTSIKGITKEELLGKEIAVPICPLEQEQISTLFKSFDNLITLHQQKRDKLLKQRKAMQQYLLTGIVRV